MSPASRHEKAIKSAKERAGKAWGLLGADLREALVCRELLVQLSSAEPDNAQAARWCEAAHLCLISET